ncbi:hypothetical protein Sjap_019266 [Stephania japonica]|uniref:TPX2 C-terminal domain-containing protein n=1 Tax=Stephania japonica TaxID=461633 RepID=A0AAP0HY05_9MAGN
MEPSGENGTADLVVEVNGPMDHEGTDVSIVDKGSEEPCTETASPSKGKSPREKSKNEKASNPKRVVATWVKKNKDGKHSEEAFTALNGSLHSASQLKQPKQGIQGNAVPERSLSAPSTARQSKSRKSGVTSLTVKTSHSEDSKELTGQSQHLKQRSRKKVEEKSNSAPSDPTTDERPQRVGSLPSYGFNFKCGERAERRKVFYSKLEEKVHAKEAEKTTLQAKSQETQDAEIKLLRKNLAFKATPMPSFYQEAPPKMELRKIPTTKPKSPKLGRRKSTPDSDGNTMAVTGPRRLSLGEETPENIIAKGSPAQYKKEPHKKSSSKVSSESSKLANSTENATEVAEPAPPPANEEDGLASQPNNTSQTNQDIAPLTENQEQPSTELEHLTDGHVSSHSTPEQN